MLDKKGVPPRLGANDSAAPQQDYFVLLRTNRNSIPFGLVLVLCWALLLSRSMFDPCKCALPDLP